QAPARRTSLAFAEAIQSLGVARVAVVSPYPLQATELFLAFLAQNGIETVKSRRSDNRSGWDSALFDQRRLVEICRATDAPNAEALVAPDTALPTLDIPRELEPAPGRPAP